MDSFVHSFFALPVVFCFDMDYNCVVSLVRFTFYRMEPKFQTSFIPKKPIVTAPGSAFSPIHSTNIFSTIATILFILTLIASLGLFLYKNILLGKISEGEKNLSEARSAFQPEKMQELIYANSRIIAVNTLLQNHLMPSRLLSLLETLTLKKTRFTRLEYGVHKGAYTLSIDGDVLSYNALSEQLDVFTSSDFLKEVTLSSFNLGENGIVKAVLSSHFSPSLVSYKEYTSSVKTDQ